MSNLFDPKIKTNVVIRTTTHEEKEIEALDKANGAAVVDFVRALEGRRPIGEADLAGDAELTAEQRAILPYAIAAKQPCLLCGGDPHIVSWIKFAQSTIGEREDSTFFYSLCKRCANLEGVVRLAEQELLSRIDPQKNKSPLFDQLQ